LEWYFLLQTESFALGVMKISDCRLQIAEYYDSLTWIAAKLKSKLYNRLSSIASGILHLLAIPG
jgi:hypothetical protein